MYRTEALDRPPLPSAPWTGGCLCGAVRYQLNAIPRAVNACHCIDCKRLSGTSRAVFLHVQRSDFTCESGDLDSWKKTGDSGNLIAASRCRTCGTRMWHEPDAAPQLVLVAAGTLDQSQALVPTSHIYLRSAGADDVIAADAIVVDGPPSDRAVLWQRFDEIYGLKR